MAHSALEETRQAPDGPVRKRLATTDERAGLRGEYEILLDGVSYLKVHQTSPTYTFLSQQRVSGGDESASQHYVSAAQLRLPS
jgi:hypothetical protein